MKIKIKDKDSQEVFNWPGGITRQFEIYPEDALGSTHYDFDFEITSSTMSDMESEYTIYNDYNRLLMIKEGSTLIKQNNKTFEMKQYDQILFDGSTQTFSKGSATDYEIIFKKDKICHLNVLKIEESYHFEINKGYFGIYCEQGFVTVEVRNQKYLLNNGDQFSIYLDENEYEQIKMIGKGILFTLEIV